MPDLELNFITGRGIIYDTAKSYIHSKKNFYSLRKQVGVQYSIEGFYPESDIVTFDNHLASTMKDLYGFDHDVTFEYDSNKNPLGSISYQLSNDGGNTWYFWDTANWVVAGPTQWNLYNEIDANISTFNFTGDKRQIRLRALLKSDDSKLSAPKFNKAHIYLDYDFNFVEDAKRSLKHFIENNVNIKHKLKKLVDCTANYIDIDSRFTVSSVIEAYNITDDPAKLINLYSSLQGNRVFLTSDQNINDVIEITYNGKAPIFLTVDPEFGKSYIPSYIISFGTVINSNLISEGARIIERNKSSLLCKERQYPTYLQVPVEVMSIADTNVTAIQMNQALQDLFEREGLPFISEAIGEEFNLFDVKSFDVKDELAKRIFNKVFSFTLSGKYWYGPATEKNLVKQITFTYASDEKIFESIEL